MHDDLVKRLRNLAGLIPHKHTLPSGADTVICSWEAFMQIMEMAEEAADAIEELVGFVQEAERDRDEYRERLDKANDAVEELERKEKFHAFLWNTIQPNEMEQYLSMYRAQAVPSQPPKEG